MPLVEETNGDGFVVRKFVAVTTRDRRRDRAVRAALRRCKITPQPELYARVWEAAKGVDDPEAVALVYQAELAREAFNRIFGHRPEALAIAARQVARAQGRLAAGKPLLALAPREEQSE